MKRFLGCAIILGLFSIPGFAATNSKVVNFPDKLTVGTTQLPAGDYNVTWTGTGPTVQVTIEQKGVRHPLTTTATAKLVEAKNVHSGIVINNKNGVDTLEAIELSNFSLVLAGASTQGQ